MSSETLAMLANPAGERTATPAEVAASGARFIPGPCRRCAGHGYVRVAGSAMLADDCPECAR